MQESFTMRTQIRLALQALTVAAACLGPANAGADEPAAEARAADSEVRSWLGRGQNGIAWAKYLDLPALESQLAEGNQADPAVLEQVRKRLESGAPGLDLPPFARLRNALAQWAEELKVVNTQDLSQAATGAEGDFRPLSDQDVAISRAATQSAASRLDQYLKTGGANGNAWKSFLGLDRLLDQLNAESPDVQALKTAREQLSANQPGLEMPVFANVRAALDRYIADLSGRNEDLKAQYSTQLKGLSEELKQYASGYSNELASSLGERLAWLENARQSNALIGAIRGRYSNPNLHGRASKRLIAAGIEQPVDEITPVRDVILGTDIRGTGHTVGNLSMALVPNSRKAEFETVLKGRVSSRTVGYNGPAVIQSAGTTDLHGTKDIYLDANGLASYPAKGTATTRTQILGISAGGAMAQKIATRRVYEMKPDAERIAGQHAAARLRHRVDAQAAAQLGKAHWNYLRKVRNPLVRLRAFPQQLNLSTVPDSLFVVALDASPSQLGAPDKPPSINVENDLAVQVHESMINNMADTLFRGVTLTEAETQRQAKDILGKVPEQLQSDETRDPWSITFAKTRPVTVRFGDNTIQITVRGQRYTSGDRDFQAMNVTAEYKIEGDGTKYKISRKPELQIEPPNFVKGRTLSGRQIALKTLLEKRFGKLFEMEIKAEGLALPGQWRKAGLLRPKQIQSASGWLVAAWIETGEPAPSEEKAAPAATAQRRDARVR
jgi:hypothetical protein